MTTEAAYDKWASAYRDWWAPVIAPAAIGVLDRLDGLLPGDRPTRIVDIGAGTGTVSLAVLERWPNAQVVAVDPSRRMLDLAADAARERGVSERLQREVGAAGRLPLADASVDAAVSTFVIQLVPSRSAAVRETFRVLRPGGAFACLTWRLEDEEFAPDAAFEDAADELRIDLPSGDPGRDQRPYSSPEAAAAEIRRAGFRGVHATEVWLEHAFSPRSYLDLLEYWIEDDVFTALDEPMRQRLRESVLRRLERLDAAALVWRRPLVSVLGRRPT